MAKNRDKRLDELECAIGSLIATQTGKVGVMIVGMKEFTRLQKLEKTSSRSHGPGVMLLPGISPENEWLKMSEDWQTNGKPELQAQHNFFNDPLDDDIPEEKEEGDEVTSSIPKVKHIPIPRQMVAAITPITQKIKPEVQSKMFIRGEEVPEVRHSIAQQKRRGKIYFNQNDQRWRSVN